MTPAILQVHTSTLPHLDFIEKILLDELIRQGRAEIISDDDERTVPFTGKNNAICDTRKVAFS
jgi:hypothetical protein